MSKLLWRYHCSVCNRVWWINSAEGAEVLMCPFCTSRDFDVLRWDDFLND